MAKVTKKKASIKTTKKSKKTIKKKNKIHPIKDLESKLKIKLDEVANLNEKNIRLLAEFDNYKRRTVKEKADIIKYSIKDFAKDIIFVIDDFERTLESITKKERNNSFYKGIKMIYDKCNEALKNQGIESYNSIGKTFDPDLHDALANQEAKGKGNDEIISEYEKGYKYHDKVIRHAKVIVCKNKIN